MDPIHFHSLKISNSMIEEQKKSEFVYDHDQATKLSQRPFRGLFEKYYMDMQRKAYLSENQTKTAIRKLKMLPSLLEKEYKSLNKKLDELGVKLTSLGEVDYSAVESHQHIRRLKRRHGEIKIALLLKNL